MNRRLLLGTAFVILASVAAASPKGTIPKSSADGYPAHTETGGAKVGAALPGLGQARKELGFDVSRTCLVVEVAIYPQKDKSTDVSLDDFSLRVTGAKTEVRPLTARSVAVSLQGQPGSQSGGVTTDTSVAVGYESGTYIDPRTGQPVKTHDVYSETGVGVGASNGGGSRRPAVGAPDPELAEAKLADKGLPEGKAPSPVAGYVYFPIPKMKKHAGLQLEYEVNGSTAVLQFPEK